MEVGQRACMNGQTTAMTPAVQIHCLRHACAVDFAGTLEAIRALGVEKLEMCSFPGCAGNPWGDFGALAMLTGETVRARLDEAGLGTVACHFPEQEFDEDRLAQAVAWAKAIGTENMVLPAISLPSERSVDDWRQVALRLNDLGTKVRDQGMNLIYHTQVEAWETVDGVTALEVLNDGLDPVICRLEVDPSGAVLSGVDWVSLLQAAPCEFFALHLRDASAARVLGGAYLPSLALGEGEMGWGDALSLLEVLRLGHWVLEMETLDPAEAFPALESSIRFVERNISGRCSNTGSNSR